MATTKMSNNNGGAGKLKLRRHAAVPPFVPPSSSSSSAANPQDLDDVECGNNSNNNNNKAEYLEHSHHHQCCDHHHAHDDGDKKDDDHNNNNNGVPLARRSAGDFLSDLSPLSRRVVRFVAPGGPSSDIRCTSDVVTAAAARLVPSLLAIVALPLLMWDGYPQEWGVVNLYPLIRHVDMVWSSLLHTSAWPIVAGTCIAAALIPRGGISTSKYLTYNKGAPSASDKALALLSALAANVTRSNWKTSLVLSLAFCSAVVVNMTFQMGLPHALWNPFIWGWYTVYLPGAIAPSLEGACLDLEKEGGQPLCLSEGKWNELSSGQLSSYNADDVLTVQRGLDYLQHQSGGVIINALARNVEESIPALRQNVDGLAPFFKDSRNKLSVVIFENDSADGTRHAFQSWADQESAREEPRYAVDLMGCGPKNPDCELGIMDRYDNMNLYSNPTASGVGKLGEFRQILLEYILAQERYADYSHMIVLDVDLGTSISPLGLLHTLGLEDGVARDHAMASSSSQVWPGTMGTIIPPYDLSAFRPKETEANEGVRGMHRSFCELMPAGDRWRNMCEACSPMQLFMIQSANDPTNHHGGAYEVASAFNGLTMYPMGLVRERGAAARYDAGDDGQRCEHVGFNRSLGRPMYVNPKWSMNLKPEKPGGPTGIRAIKTLMYAVLGRPNVMLCLVIGDLLFFFAFVYPCWMIARAVGSLFLLASLPRERRCPAADRCGDKRELFGVPGVDARAM